MPTFKPASPPPFRPERAGLDQAAVEALRQQLHRVSSALDAANGNVRARLGDAEAQTAFTVVDQAGARALALDSDGNLVVTTIATPDAVWTLGEFVEVDTLDGWIVKGNIVTVTAAYSVTARDYTILADATAGSFDILLPDAATVDGQIFNIKRIDGTSNEVAITTTSSQTIDGYTSGEIGPAENESFAVQSDGANWRIV